MARNGSGTYSVPNTAVAGTTITSSDYNENFTDLGSEITNSVAVDGQSTMSGPLKLPSGTVGAPAWTFGNDPDTGGYRIGANELGFAVGGNLILDIPSTGIAVTGNGTFSGVVKAGNGAVTAPGLAFGSEADCGLYVIGTNNLGVAVGGSKIIDAATTGISITGTLSATGAISGATTTITSTNANALAVGGNGATNPVLKVDASTASAATGISITGAAAAGGVAVTAISSGTNENLTIDAKGSGTVTINGTATGAVTITPATTITGALTANNAAGITAKNSIKAYGCVTVTNSVPTLQESFNISSTVTRNDTGDYTVTFNNALASANFAAVVTPYRAGGQAYFAVVKEKTTTTLRVQIRNIVGDRADADGFDFYVVGN